MDPFAAMPVEVRQSILAVLPDLRHLQAAVIGCRSLHHAYQGSRILIRQLVFCNETLESTSVADNGEDRELWLFTLASRRVEDLERRNPHDGVVLREGLWPHIIAHQQNQSQKSRIICTWSRDLAEAYRSFHHEEKAKLAEGQAMNLLWPCQGLPGPMGSTYELFFNCLRSTLTACSRHRLHEYGATLCDEIWKRLEPVGHESGLELIKATSLLCNGTVPEASHPAVDTVIARGWAFLQHMCARVHRGGEFCYSCLDGAKLLLAATRSAGVDPHTAASYIETIWKESSLRSSAFGSWCTFFVESNGVEASRLECVLKVWARLREFPDQAQIETYDLEWARAVICEMKQQDDNPNQSLTFQASVLALLSAGSPRYNAFARNLADAYLKSGNISAAIDVRERVWETLLPSSQLYTSWGLALIRLYRKAGREEEARVLNDVLKKKLQS